MHEFPYPITPANVSEKVTQPSPEFKSEVMKVLMSIVLFIVVYFLLMAGAFGLAVLTGYGGVMLVVSHPSFITLMLGLGLVGLGIMVLFFVVKFLFKQVKADRSHLVEIKRKDQPELFSFIEKLTKEIGAPFPKRIYLSADVNASVFYDSGFWSMFLPVRKNLQIGLGLVNAMNMSELKAVLAHEFGHFSQRSMKLGSYVYNVNQVIHNMLYDNQGYGQALEKWGNLNGYFAFFSNLTVGIVQGIQYILRSMYGFINKNYMGLSRQMEFHADAVAASAAGGNHLITALLRLNVAASSHERLLETYGAWIGENLKAENMYPHHHEVMKHFAAEFEIPVVNNLPQLDEKTFRKLSASRVVIKDQWASHPSTEDRAEHLQQLNINTEAMNLPAWSILREPEKLQKQMTDMVYAAATFPKTPEVFNESIFRERFYGDINRYRLDPIYKGFYDYRSISNISFDKPLIRDAGSLSEILTEELLHSPKKLAILNNDIQTLEAVRMNAAEVKTFEFDGRRYGKEEIGTVIDQLQSERTMLEGEVAYADSRIAALAYAGAQAQGLAEEMKLKYNDWAIREKEAKESADRYMDIMTIVRPAYEGQMTVEIALDIDNKLKLNEKPIKELMRKFLDETSIDNIFTADEKQKLSTYVNEKLNYFTIQRGFDNDALGLFTQAMNIFYQAAAQRSFQAKKAFLDWQVQFLK